MALPSDDDVQTALLELLAEAHNGRMHCNDVYRELARHFPALTRSKHENP